LRRSPRGQRTVASSWRSWRELHPDPKERTQVKPRCASQRSAIRAPGGSVASRSSVTHRDVWRSRPRRHSSVESRCEGQVRSPAGAASHLPSRRRSPSCGRSPLRIPILPQGTVCLHRRGTSGHYPRGAPVYVDRSWLVRSVLALAVGEGGPAISSSGQTDAKRWVLLRYRRRRAPVVVGLCPISGTSCGRRPVVSSRTHHGAGGDSLSAEAVLESDVRMPRRDVFSHNSSGQSQRTSCTVRD